MNKIISIRILGGEYRVSCPSGGEQDLHHCAAEIDKQLRTVRRNVGSLTMDQAAILVALNLVRELRAARDGLGDAEAPHATTAATAATAATGKLQALQRKLDEALRQYE